MFYFWFVEFQIILLKFKILKTEYKENYLTLLVKENIGS